MGSLVKNGLSAYRTGVKSSIAMARYSTHSTQAILDGAIFPAFDAVLEIQGDVIQAAADTLSSGDGKGFVETIGQRMTSATRFQQLVETLGKDLFGSASFEGEHEIGRNEIFRLVYIPPKEVAGFRGPAVFHAGGSIPYGDRIFRLLPEYNFYGRFSERGLPVYAMELIGDRFEHDYSRLTLPILIDSIRELSSTAFAHNGNRKLVLEGYCGQGTQSLAYVCADPPDADAKFSVVTTFVSPIDGSRCTSLAEAIQRAPEPLIEANLALWDRTGGYTDADQARIGLDVSLRALFDKTPLGYFHAGWRRKDLAKVTRIEDLDKNQRRDLAGAYWVSPDCARRFPVPADISRFTSALFGKGPGPKGEIPCVYRGETLTYSSLARTRLRFVGIFGGRDPVVPDVSGHYLFPILGDRYEHIVHPEAGHISYILSPRMWAADQPKGFRPNPVDVIVDADRRARES